MCNRHLKLDNFTEQMMTADTKHARASSRYILENLLLALLGVSQTAVALDVFSRQTALLEQRTMTPVSGLFWRETIDINNINGVVTGNDITAYDVVDVSSCTDCASLCVNVNCVSYACHNQLCTPVSINVLKRSMQIEKQK